MRLGYSILLGETLEAISLQYRDCERFQVVCPHCHEPVFKVRRAADSLEEMHYFAHYAASKAYQGQCDLRTNSFTHADIERKNSVSRDQRLVYFLSVLRRTLGMSPYYVLPAEKVHYRLEKSPAFMWLRNGSWETLSQNNSANTFDVTFEDYLYRMHDSGWALNTSFSIERQKQIARDMWLMITTPPGHSNFNFLFNHAWLIEISAIVSRQEEASGMDRVVMVTMADFMARIIDAKKSNTADIIHELATTHLPDGYNVQRGVNTDADRSSFMSRLLGNLTIDMVGALLQLPFFELLKQQYGDPNKIYPYQPGIAPVDEEEIEKMKQWNAKYGRKQPLN